MSHKNNKWPETIILGIIFAISYVISIGLFVLILVAVITALE